MDAGTVVVAVAGVLALADWVAVGCHAVRAERLLKPAVPAALLVAVLVGSVDGDARWFVVAALVLGLLGDVALLPGATDRRFLAGLAAFLLGHVAYIAAFLRYGVHGWETLGGALFAVGVGALMLPAVLRGAVRLQGREFAVLLGAYAVVVAVMTAAAGGTTLVLTAIGGALFLISDALLARERFVRPTSLGRVPVGDLAVIVSYHAAQGLIVLGLLHPGVLA